MKKFASLCLISAVTLTGSVRADALKLAEAPAPAPIAGNVGTALKDNVNVRARADKNSEVLTQLKKGDTIEIRERKGEWLRIGLPESGKCYVAAKFLKDGEITGDAVNVRCGPGTNFREVGKLNKGERVTVVKTEGEWSQIKPTPHCSGWVAAELIEISAPTPVPAPLQTSEAPLPALTPMPVSAAVALAESSDEVHIQYVVKDGYLAVVKEPQAPAPFVLMTQNIMGREYVIAYLETTQTNLSRYEGRHVRVVGNQRWKKGDRYPVIAIERCEPVL
jgi:SH3-like domain-containing protein